MSVDTKEEPFPIAKNRSATADIVFECAQGLTVNGQHPLSVVFLLLGLSLLDLTTAFWAEGVSSTESLSALGA